MKECAQIFITGKIWITLPNDDEEASTMYNTKASVPLPCNNIILPVQSGLCTTLIREKLGRCVEHK